MKFHSKHELLSGTDHVSCEGLPVPIGVVLQAPFLSFHKLTDKWPAMFDNEKKIDKIFCPVLFVHGTKDQFVPIAHPKVYFQIFFNPFFTILF